MSDYCANPLNRGRGTPIKRIPTRKVTRKSVWPAPIYEAHMSDGEVIRMSFHSPVGKPLDMARARRLVLSCTSQPMGWTAILRQRAGTWKAPIIRYGAVHWDGRVIVDEATIADVKAA